MFTKSGAVILLLPGLLSSCVAVQPATDTGDAVTPQGITAPSSPSNPTGPAPSTALAYDPDLKAIFATDCLVCHGGNRADGNYRMNTYAQVMTAVRPGNASSALVVTTQSGGRMYRYFSGSNATRQTKASEVLSWVMTYRAQETR